MLMSCSLFVDFIILCIDDTLPVIVFDLSLLLDDLWLLITAVGLAFVDFLQLCARHFQRDFRNFVTFWDLLQGPPFDRVILSGTFFRESGFLSMPLLARLIRRKITVRIDATESSGQERLLGPLWFVATATVLEFFDLVVDLVSLAWLQLDVRAQAKFPGSELRTVLKLYR